METLCDKWFACCLRLSSSFVLFYEPPRLLPRAKLRVVYVFILRARIFIKLFKYSTYFASRFITSYFHLTLDDDKDSREIRKLAAEAKFSVQMRKQRKYSRSKDKRNLET
jgi:hypothetical protein